MAAAKKPEHLATAWIEGFAILVAVAVVSLVTAGSDYKKEGQFLKQQAIAEVGKVVSTLSIYIFNAKIKGKHSIRAGAGFFNFECFNIFK